MRGRGSPQSRLARHPQPAHARRAVAGRLHHRRREQTSRAIRRCTGAMRGRLHQAQLRRICLHVRRRIGRHRAQGAAGDRAARRAAGHPGHRDVLRLLGAPLPLLRRLRVCGQAHRRLRRGGQGRRPGIDDAAMVGRRDAVHRRRCSGRRRNAKAARRARHSDLRGAHRRLEGDGSVLRRIALPTARTSSATPSSSPRDAIRSPICGACSDACATTRAASSPTR